MRYNDFNQPIGDAVEHFTAGELPDVQVLSGRFCRLERLSPEAHFEDLWQVYNADTPPQNWTYLPKRYGPFEDKTAFLDFLQCTAAATDPYCFAIIDASTNQAVGSFSLMRIDPNYRVVEMGAVIYSARLKRSKIATEAQFLMAQYVFETLQYRRYEWKCDALNAPSRHAAERPGFRFEGIFRQAMVYHGRNRDTAWFSMLDSEWAQRKQRFLRWLADDNFNADGSQKTALSEIPLE
ncbi:GNAT family N-acetyltransferase [Aggregatibacter kilianii]|uniref:GNAT family N-acetyltransferase n=1 Tax=Aggregatibacter kilianii TaxID=2025884 RepID=UPI000D652797|nr:GNAT family protein [Aggregatibacter kilianii]